MDHRQRQRDGRWLSNCVLLPEPQQETEVDWMSWTQVNDAVAVTTQCHCLNKKHMIPHTTMKTWCYETDK